MGETQETVDDIVAEKRRRADEIERDCAERMRRGEMVSDRYARELVADIRQEADRLEAALRRDKAAIEADALAVGGIVEAALKREAQSIERIVRDAIIDYNEMYPSAPNDEAERDLRERAARANAWLKQHGFEEEPVIWSKEETPCL